MDVDSLVLEKFVPEKRHELAKRLRAEGMTRKEIGDTLGVKLNTVKDLLSYTYTNRKSKRLRAKRRNAE